MQPFGDIPYKALFGLFVPYGPDGKQFSNIMKGGKKQPDAKTVTCTVIGTLCLLGFSLNNNL